MCDFSIQIETFEKTLQTLFHRVLETCKKSGMIKEQQMEHIQKSLEEMNLTPALIVESCVEELKSTCLFEYMEVVPGSNRYQGKGNSTYKIEHYMKVFLREKLKLFSSVLSQNYSLLHLQKSSIQKQKSFTQVLEDIKIKIK